VAKGESQTQTGKSRERSGTGHECHRWVSPYWSTWQASGFSAQILGGWARSDRGTSGRHEVCAGRFV